jgi:SAM-dependent methyltransferase
LKFRRLVKALLKRDLATINKNLSRKGLYEFLEEQFALIEKGETVLSIGAGGGVNRLLKTYQKGDLFSVVETDIDESRGPDIVADLCDPNISIQQGPFSTIVCSEVLEHCYDPFQAIKNMHGLLEKNGRLVLTTPFLFPLHEEPIDFFRYTKHGLLHLTRDFSDVKVKQSNRYGDAFLVFLVRYGGFGKFGAWATTILAYCLLPFGWLLNRGASNRFGTTRYLVVATR